MSPLTKAPKFVIINPDVNAPKSTDADNAYVTSIFHTVQGEGPFAGHSALFLRLAGCNYGDKRSACSFCDTFFALEDATKTPVEQLAQQVVAEMRSNKCKLLVVTGGEPFRQDDMIAKLLYALHKQWRSTSTTPEDMTNDELWVQFETNGSYKIPATLAAAKRIYDAYEDEFMDFTFMDIMFVVSPKPVRGNSSGSALRYPKNVPLFESIKELNNTFMQLLFKNSCLKYLVDHDLPEVPAYEDMYPKLHAIYLSPVTVYKEGYPRSEVADIFADYINQEKTQANYRRAANLVMIHGKYVLSLQTHLFIGIE